MESFKSHSRVSRPGYIDPLPRSDHSRAVGGHTSYDAQPSYDSIKRRENDEDYYKSKKNRDDDRGTKRAFYSLSEEWQKEKAKAFGIKVVKSFRFGNTKYFYDRTPPSKTVPVEGDGNCFFRAISMCITGSETEHTRVREHITKHVGDNPDTYRTFLQSRGGMSQYLRVMRRDREWATDVEILAAATLLKTVIEVYFPCRINGRTEFRWQTFKPLNNEDMTYPVIYLSNKNDHFDPVVDISADDDIEERKPSERHSHSETPRQSRDSRSQDHDPTVYARTVPNPRPNHESSFSRVMNTQPGYQTYSSGAHGFSSTKPSLSF